MRTLSVKQTSVEVAVKATSASPASPQSPWHSPVPYLFGGLAAMLGLIAFALLILACSYWRASGEVSGNEDGGEKESRSGEKTANAAYEEKVLVIMAGEDLPRFLATPANKGLGHEGKMVISEDGGGGEGDKSGEDGEGEKVKESEQSH
ncbi:PREDICTED: protein GLUTAMINE DUMPER 4 [Tarenaya hassleriana]|uniref:protein GLUTAMINE DUMPER 4 n=1 Tax=Tarenaya hassleriana TaxID=28532 RepID=UPI00053C284B|nr:PREDICTED: protein GLUTAMINE DUMPER 4 [Tarenaya hassleriana]